jgi:phosphate-selective porin OprO/OprP
MPVGPAPETIEPLPNVEGVEGYYQRLAELEAAARAANAKMPLVRLSGFFDWDTAWFSQDAGSIATLGKIQNGSGFRRARLQALGKVTEQTNFSLEMDFATAGHPSFFDVWMEQMNLPVVGTVRLGQFRQPVTMDSWTSVRHLEFMERSAPFQAFDPFRRIGIMGWANSEDGRTNWGYSMYGTGFTYWNGTATQYGSSGDSRNGTLLSSQGGVSLATRATHLLYYDEPTEGRYLLHLGGGFNFSEIGGNGTTGSDARTYQARAFPEVFVGDADGSYVTAAGTPSVVDSGKFLANN